MPRRLDSDESQNNMTQNNDNSQNNMTQNNDDSQIMTQDNDDSQIMTQDNDDSQNMTQEQLDAIFEEEKETAYLPNWDSDNEPMVMLRQSLKVLVVEVNRKLSPDEERVKYWVTQECPQYSDLYSNKDQMISFVRSALPDDLAAASVLINQYRQTRLSQIETLDSLSSLSQEEKVKVRNELHAARNLRKKIRRYTDN